MKRKIMGIMFVLVSIVLSLANILSVKITGAVVGINIKSSLLTILTFVFFFGGLLFLSRLERKIIAGLIAAGTIFGGVAHKIHSDKQYIKDSTVTAPYWTEQGKFQRTYRWDKELDRTERRHKIPRGLLKGLAMRESYGDPLRLNQGKDGGGGLFMFQPGTAREMGLKVYGDSKRVGADRKHGEQLKKLIEANNYDYGKMAEIDERFDVKKATDAAARYLTKQYNKHGSWDKALSAYNQGKPAPNPEKTKHVKAVREYQKYYRARDKRGRR